jgi:hypothetical protein
MTESEISKSKSKKGKLKKAKIRKRKALTSEISRTAKKICKVMSDEQIQCHREYVKLFHRSDSCHVIATLSLLSI